MLPERELIARGHSDRLASVVPANAPDFVAVFAKAVLSFLKVPFNHVTSAVFVSEDNSGKEIHGLDVHLIFLAIVVSHILRVIPPSVNLHLLKNLIGLAPRLWVFAEDLSDDLRGDVRGLESLLNEFLSHFLFVSSAIAAWSAFQSDGLSERDKGKNGKFLVHLFQM